MKKITFILIGLMFISSSLSAQAYLPDDNFEAYIESLNLGNGVPNDNYVSFAGVASITTLIISDKGIQDLTGLENFTSLTTLIANNNDINHFDLSNNPALTLVFASNNPIRSINVTNLTNLTSLDIGSNKAGSSDLNLDLNTNTGLEALYLVDSKISQLDVSNNTALHTLHLARTTNLSFVDLRNNLNLYSLYLFDSNVESVDLRNGNNTNITTFSAYNAPNLTCVSVDDVPYSTANWTNITNSSAFSEHCNDTYVPDDNFEAFLEANGMGNGIANDDYVTTANISSVTSLQITTNVNISDLTGIEAFTALETFWYIGLGFSVSTLDLSSNTNLKDLRLVDLNLNALDVSSNTALETLITSYTSIMSLDVSNNTLLETLDVRNSNVTALDLTQNTALTKFYGSNTPLEVLNAQNGTNGIITVFEISGTPNLSCVNVDNAAYSTANWTVKDATTSYSEHCYETYVPDNNFEAYLEANGMGNGIANDDYVTTANINSVITLTLGNDTSISDLTGIEDFTALQSLITLGNTFIANIDVSNNSSLQNLLLNGTSQLNSLNINGLTSLQSLSIGGTQLTSIDLSSNVGLTSLTINDAPLSSIDLSNNVNLQSFYFTDNTTLTDIDLSNNALLVYLSGQNSAIQTLNLKNGNNSLISTLFLTGATNLLCVKVDNASYSTTNWTNIESQAFFSETCGLTNVPDDNFEAFLEANNMGNGITNDNNVFTDRINTVISLDISNQSITDITGLEAFTALETFIANNNTISIVDFSTNTALKYINLNTNSISSLDVTSLTALETLIASTNSISSIDLSNNSALKLVGLSQTNLTSIDLTNNPNLEEVYLMGINSMSSIDLKNGNNTNITNFSAILTDVGCINVDSHSYAIANWSANVISSDIFSEHCNETYVPDDVFEAHLEANGMGNGIANDDYVSTPAIEAQTLLFIQDSNVSDLTGIASFTNLETLIVRRSNLSSLDLSGNTALTMLSFEDNQITSIDLSSNTELTQIITSNNALGTLDVSNLTKLTVIESINNGLTSLDISNNTLLNALRVGDNQLTEIDVSSHTSLIQLSAPNNNLTSLNAANGNNSNFNLFDITGNTNLSCVNVDNAAYSAANWTQKEATTSYSEHCYETYVPDDNFEAYLETNSLGNGIANDNYVTTSNIASLTSLNVNNQNISDLTGIEDFQSLTTLVVSNNNLSNLDLSNKASLTHLQVQDNPLTAVNTSDLTNLIYLDLSRTSISSLDVSNNSALQSLRLIRSTGLSSIDVSTNTALTLLHLAETSQITSVDLKNNTNLTALYLFRSNVESVDLRNGNNTNITAFLANDASYLTCINVDDAAYSIANWTFIDDSSVFSEHCNETYVPDNDFEAHLEANGMGNGIANDDYASTPAMEAQTLLFIQDSNVSDLTGIEAFVNLETLIVRRSNLTSLDLSANTALTMLSFEDNQITSIDLSANTELTQIITSNNALGTLDVSNLTKLTVIESINNGLTTLDISNNPLLIALRVGDNQLTSIDVSSHTSLIQLSAPNNNLEFLDVANGNNSNFNIFDITGNTNLSCVNVDNATYSTTNWTQKEATTFYGEYCNETFVPDDNFEAYLETHDANGNTVSVGDVNSMGNGIVNDNYVITSKISSITSLDLTNQSISDLTGLENFTALEVLEADNNNLSSINVSSNTSLTYLNFHSNTSVTAIDVSTLTSLESLILHSTSITSIDVSNNTTLKTLHLNNTNITSLNVSSNTALENLWIRNISGLTSVNLNVNTALTFLDVQEASITSLDLSNNTALTEFYANNGALEFLDVRNGNNGVITTFQVSTNPNLSCVNVDNATYSTTNWTNKDAHTSYGEHCHETYVPDDDFEAHLEANGMGNGIANDNYASTPTMEAQTLLLIQDSNVSDLTGIAAFTNLETLIVRRSNLTSLDVNANTALKMLSFEDNQITSMDLSSNTELTQIITSNNALGTLDVSNLTKLTSIESINNGLSSIDISNNPLLTTLRVGGNQITSIDVSSHPSLIQLSAPNNSLVSLNVANGNNSNFSGFDTTGNTNLGCIKVDNESYATTNWTSIDVHTIFSQTCGVTNVPDDNFEAYLEANNMGNGIANDNLVFTGNISGVISLDISSQGISDLTGIEAFVALEILNARSNSITSVDFTSNTALKELNLGYNSGLTVLDVSYITTLEVLNARRTGITSIDLSNNVALTTIDFLTTDIVTLDLSKNVNLTDVNFADMGSLQWVNLNNGNNINITSFTAIINNACFKVDDRAYSLANWTSIPSGTEQFYEYCDGLDTQIPDDNFENYLETHDANGNLVSVGDPASMGNGVANDNYVFTANISSVTNLDIGSQSISDLTGIEVFTALQILIATNNSLSTVDLSSNTNLTTLNIGSNSSITGIDVSSNTALINLNISNTSITDLDLRNNTALIDFVANNGALQSLDLRNGNNTNINTFDVSGNSNLTCISVDDVDYADTNWSSHSGEYSISCGETFVPDDNFEMYLETHDNIGRSVSMGDPNSLGNGSMDNFVTTTKLESVSDLDVRSKNIADLTGIEDFIYLLDLNITNNPITSLNLPPGIIYRKLYLSGTALTSLDVSSFTFLKTLDISNTSISNIDVSNNTSLEELSLGNTSISTLDLSTNTSITSLDVNNASISSLDLSNNSALTSLVADGGVLESLDLRNGNNTSILYFNALFNPSLTCIQVDDADYSNTNWTNVDGHTSFGEDGCGVQLSIKVFLHGPYESGSGMMRASLGATHLPTNTPHSDGATASSSVFDVTGNNAIVDWVWVELRDKNDITTVLHSASGLVQRDGDIVGVDGVSPIVIAASADEYYVSVDHRSHIPIASDATYNLSGTATTIDLTVSSNVRGGAGFMHDLGNGKHATFGGDLNGDGQINTADLILGFASIGLPGYLVRDLDLNGQTQTSDMTNVLVKGLGKGKQF